MIGREKSRLRAPNLICAGNRHDEAHGRATRGKIARAAETPAEFSFKAVYGRLNCDRREKSRFSTQSVETSRALLSSGTVAPGG
jgi:hypothetical protein